MVDFKELRKILNGSNMSVKHYANGRKVITDSQTFRGMNISALEEAQGMLHLYKLRRRHALKLFTQIVSANLCIS